MDREKILNQSRAAFGVLRTRSLGLVQYSQNLTKKFGTWITSIGGSHMSMTRCESGHYYDSARHSACPTCNASASQSSPTKAPAAKGKPGAAIHTIPVTDNRASNQMIGDQTVAIVMKEHGFDPVVGWLVCTKGPDRGQDYRVRAEKNFIGRSPQMDIAITGDATISRENHISISFNPKKNSFKLIPGETRGLVYLNEEELVGPTDLKKGDKIGLGESELVFVPFAGEYFEWSSK